MREAGAVSADLWQVEPARLRILDGFNARVKNDAYAERVRFIADSIKANGYYKDKPLSGFVAREGDENVIYVTGGHRRHEAVMLAISEGVELPSVPVIVRPKGTSMEDLTVALVVGNDGEPLSLYEAAVVCKRLAAFGWDSTEIARRLGYASTQYVDGLLALAGAPLAIRKMVMENVVAATTAIDAINKHGDKALDVLLAAMVKSAGGRVTAKHLPQADFKKAVRKQAEPMYTALTKVQADHAKVIVWTPQVKAEMSGPRLACTIELFRTVDLEKMHKALEEMQKIYDVRKAKAVATSAITSHPKCKVHGQLA